MSELHRASNAQALALHKFKDGCAALIENPLQAPSSGAGRPAVRDVTPLSSRPRPAVPARVNIERNEIAKVNLMSCTDGGSHRFDIHTQCCVWCGGTYRKLKSRAPEFMK
jgi:hypothetical protein